MNYHVLLCYFKERHIKERDDNKANCCLVSVSLTSLPTPTRAAPHSFFPLRCYLRTMMQLKRPNPNRNIRPQVRKKAVISRFWVQEALRTLWCDDVRKS
jgi:hypothetical protein